MHRIRQEDLPHRGSSHRFVGADQGDTGISVFLFNGQPGSGPGPHRHPYDEVQFIQQGRGLYTVDGETFQAGAGDILVIKAGEVHSLSLHRRFSPGADGRAPEPRVHPGEPGPVEPLTPHP